MRSSIAGVVLACLYTSGVWVAPAATIPPDPADPLIFGVRPAEAQQGQQVRIDGFNFGSAPQVTFNGVAAPIIEHRPDYAELYVVVPSGASSGPLIVTNTNTAASSNQAAFVVAPGTYTPVCTIVGTITDNTMAALADTVVAAVGSTGFAGVDLSDASGNYAIGLAAGGEYQLHIMPPFGTSFVSTSDPANCPGTLNQQLAVGSQLSGTLVENQTPFDPVPNAFALAFLQGGGNFTTVSDAIGDFSFHVPDGTYVLFVIGPVGGRQIAQIQGGIVVSGDTSLGDVALDLGSILSGVARYQDDAGTGPLAVAVLELADSLGEFAGYGYTIVDGSFWLAGQPGTDNTLYVGGPGLSLEVQSVDLTSDTELDHTLTVYSPDGHAPTLPTIISPNFLFLQEARPTAFEGVNFGGSSVSVRFPDGIGGWVDGDDTHLDPVRGLIVTRVPTLAASGDAHVRVDGVDGPGYPVTIDPGIYDPGNYTISGTVTDGSDPTEGVLVALLGSDCDDNIVADYDVTDAGGAYTVNHATGDYLLYLLPPVPSGLMPKGVELPDLTGNTVSDVVLGIGSNLTGWVVDSGIGPVGATSAPIPNSLIEVEGSDVEGDETLLSDVSGLFSMNLAAGFYDVFVEGPPQSRYLTDWFSSGAPADLGNIPIDSGYFVEGYVVDDLGVGLPGFEVAAVDTQSWVTEGSAMTVGDTGWFRMAVPAGTYNIDFWAHDDDDHSVQTIQDVAVWTDTLLYPAFEAGQASRLQGTVYHADGTTPVPGSDVWAFDFTSGQWIAGSCTGEDGTYDIRVGPGTYNVLAWPDGGCLAIEWYEEELYSCFADPVTVTSVPMTGIDFTLDPGGSISGRVVDDWGVGVPGVQVFVNDDPAESCGIHGDSTAGDGSYRLDRIPVGVDLRVQVFPSSYPRECWDDHLHCSDFDPITVNECVDTTGIDFTVSDTPGPVPDGAFVPGTPLTASHEGGMLTVNWQPTCNAAGHSLYYGNLGQSGSYSWAICDIGVTGTFSTPAPSGDVFFLVVGNTWTYEDTWSNEGSYGLDSNGIERPSALGAYCGHTQDLSHNCTP